MNRPAIPKITIKTTALIKLSGHHVHRAKNLIDPEE
jgi:hypothetical protein